MLTDTAEVAATDDSVTSAEKIATAFQNAEEVEAVLGVPVLGHCPAIEPEALRILRDVSSFSPIMESYRSLRTNLRLMGDTPLRSILVTSSVPAEGKSTVTANLAIAYAMSLAFNGKRVLLIDGDLRRPAQHKIFRVDCSCGVTDVLTAGVTLEKAAKTTTVDGLLLLTAGSPPTYPTELLESDAMSRLLEEAERKYDMVIIDSPPLLAVADAMVLAVQVDGVVVAIGCDETRQTAVLKTMELLNRVKANVAGAVLNRIPNTFTSYYYGDNHTVTDVPTESSTAG